MVLASTGEARGGAIACARELVWTAPFVSSCARELVRTPPVEIFCARELVRTPPARDRGARDYQ
jgi:hypothetical protein